MTAQDPAPKSFWTTMPGILTGVAAVVTALAALLAALADFGGSPPTPVASDSPAAAPVAEAPREGSNRTSGDNSPIVTGTGGNVTVDIKN